MEMTRRQFALSPAAASYSGRSLFEPLSPLGFRAGSFLGDSLGRTIPRQ